MIKVNYKNIPPDNKSFEERSEDLLRVVEEAVTKGDNRTIELPDLSRLSPREADSMARMKKIKVESGLDDETLSEILKSFERGHWNHGNTEFSFELKGHAIRGHLDRKILTAIDVDGRRVFGDKLLAFRQKYEKALWGIFLMQVGGIEENDQEQATEEQLRDLL